MPQEENLQQAPEEYADEALYNFLADRQSCSESHGVLLHLSGFDDAGDGRNVVFEMLLSGCANCTSGTTRCRVHWQAPTCTRERSRLDRLPRLKVEDICRKVQEMRERGLPEAVPLASGHPRNTNTPSNCDYGQFRIPLHLEEPPSCVSLETLLSRGQLSVNSLSDVMRNSRLALRLAQSLHTLCFGPWVQQDWSGKNIYIIGNGEGEIGEMLDETYIGCILTNPQRHERIGPDILDLDRMSFYPPQFYLSLAQLLADIGNGELGNRHMQTSSETESRRWYDALAREVVEGRYDRIMKHYWKAVEGCLLFTEHFRHSGIPHPRVSAKLFVGRTIVGPLRTQLRTCEEELARLAAVENEASS